MLALLLSASSVRAFSPPSRLLSKRAFAPSSTRRSESVSDDEFADFSSQIAFMFPGQGAQFVGMCAEVCANLPAAKALFDEASEILGYDLLDKCTNGPKEVLDTTAVSQPAIFVASMAAVEQLKATSPHVLPTVAMGLSLGEYSALCYAGALDFKDGVKITKARGEAMQAASDAVDSGMVSVIGLDSDTVKELCLMASEKSGAKVEIANYLCTGNYAVSGATSACDAVVELAKPEFKARMTVKLAVAGAFHTDFMKPAVEKLEKVLEGITFKKPRIPVISNVDARPHSDPEVIKKLLATQVTSPVMWEKTMESIIAGGLEKAYELGPGKVTAGILKRFDKKLECENIEV